LNDREICSPHKINSSGGWVKIIVVFKIGSWIFREVEEGIEILYYDCLTLISPRHDLHEAGNN
jgi:hypothetical protein